jgi:hypothetical protein
MNEMPSSTIKWNYWAMMVSENILSTFWLFHFFIKYEWRALNWLYQLLWMARKWFEHFDGKIDFHLILLKKEIIEGRLLQIFFELEIVKSETLWAVINLTRTG